MIGSEYCPGAKNLKEAMPEEQRCGRCGSMVEIWTDETKRACSNCGMLVYRHNANEVVSCAEWCPAARACLGEEVYAKWQAMKASATAKSA